jgi:hypothetical protein
MDFPPTFPNSLKAKAAAAVLRAQRQFQAQHQAKERIEAGIFSFAKIARVAVKKGEWRADLALDGLDAFLHTLCAYEPAASGFTNSGGFDRFAGPIKREITTSERWLRVVKRLAAVGEDRTEPSQASRREELPDEHRATADSGRVDPEIAKRNAIVRNNAGTPNKGLCALLDDQQVPVPQRWVSSNWTQAYKSPELKSKVQVILAKAKQKRV